MRNGNEWLRLHAGFLSDSHMLLCLAGDCLDHLALIKDDRDAMEGLHTALEQLAARAGTHGIQPLHEFAQQLSGLVCLATAAGHLHPAARLTLEHCLALMGWQLELIDPHTGSLALDDNEQRALLGVFACLCGLGKWQDCRPGAPDRPASAARRSAATLQFVAPSEA
jgi:hypothetical protein